MIHDPDRNDDHLEQRVLEALHTSPMPDDVVRQRIVAALEARGVLTQEQSKRFHLQWAMAAAAAIAVFVLGMQVGERRAQVSAELTSPPLPARVDATAAPSVPSASANNVVLWF